MTHTEVLKIEGMSCGHCVRAVREALEEMEGVTVDNVEIGSASIVYDDDQVPRERIVEAVDEAGYAVA